MKKNAKLFKTLIPIALGIFLCYYAYNSFTEDQRSEIVAQIQGSHYSFLFLSILFGVFSHISRGLRWQYTLNELGFSPKRSTMIASVFIANLLNVTIPRSGEVSRAFLLTKYENIPFEKSFGTIVAERVIDLCMLGGFVLLAFALKFDFITTFLLKKLPWEQISMLLLVGFTFLLLLFFLLKRFKNGFLARINAFMLGIKEGIFSIFSLKKKWHFLAHTLFIWTMYFLMFSVCFLALEETASCTFSEIVACFVVGSFAVTFTNGGFGSYPLFIAEMLAIFGIPLTIGTALGWLTWLSQFLMILLFGAISFLILPILYKK